MKRAEKDGAGSHVDLDLDDEDEDTESDQAHEHPADSRPLLRQLPPSRLYQFDLRNAGYFAAVEPRHVTIVCRSTRQPFAWFYGIHKLLLADLMANPNAPGNSGLDPRLERLLNDLTHGVGGDDTVAMSLYTVESSGLGLGSAHSVALAFSRALPGMQQQIRGMNPSSRKAALVMAAAGGVTAVPRPTKDERHWLLIEQSATRIVTHADIDHLTDPEDSPYNAFELDNEDWDPQLVAM
ncbi:hypothetical protein VARIO8X_60159 [Burkholderiales bacterium 8X]|nr:hypothetical protein VARIO8X_60159 [Burkholderiales bacterium 8X]